jgi:hypothetical protein
LSSPGLVNFYVSKYDSSGANILAKGGYLSPGNGSVVGESLSFDRMNNVYVCGYFGTYNPNSYDANFEDLTLPGIAFTDLFVLKLKDTNSTSLIPATLPELLIPNLILTNVNKTS